MVVRIKESFEKTRQVKKIINLKNTFYEDKETQDITKKFYQTKRNLIIFSKMVMKLSTYTII